MKSVLFLCTGNYYRSRFAEIVFNGVARRMGLSWTASSRGLALERGTRNVGPVAKTVLVALEKLGIRDFVATSRMPMSVSAGDLEAAARVIALSGDEHRPLMQERFPEWVDRVEYWEVADDAQALPPIEREVMGLIARLLGGTASAPEAPVSEAPVPAKPKKRLAKVGRETAGRRGKGVTTVFDIDATEDELKELAAHLKQRCGTGGTAKDGRIEIQGDQRDRIVQELEKLGFQVKRAGG